MIRTSESGERSLGACSPRASKKRESRVCSSGESSATSSMKMVPRRASASLAGSSKSAPVATMNGCPARRLRCHIQRASVLLPVPLSPRSSTVESVAAARSAAARKSRKTGLSV
ncbi:MAG: hypothetical protein U0271_26365 [Polyangiaceae bacterium]